MPRRRAAAAACVDGARDVPPAPAVRRRPPWRANASSVRDERRRRQLAGGGAAGRGRATTSSASRCGSGRRSAERRSGCCSLDDFLDARRVAEQLGIPFYVMDFRDAFGGAVVDAFVGEYRRGRTPNPCALQPVREVRRLLGPGARARRDAASRPGTTRSRAHDDGGAVTARAASMRTRISRTSSSASSRRCWRRRCFPVGGLRKVERARRGGAARPAGGRQAGQPGGVLRAARRYAAFVARQASSVPARGRSIVDEDGQVVATTRRRAPLHDRAAPRPRRQPAARRAT